MLLILQFLYTKHSQAAMVLLVCHSTCLSKHVMRSSGALQSTKVATGTIM